MSESITSESGHSAFRTSEKYFKSRAPHPAIASGLIRRRLKKGRDPTQSYPLFQGQGVLDLSRPSKEGKEDEVRRAGWKSEDDPLAGRPARQIKVHKPVGQGVETIAGYIVGDGESRLASFNINGGFLSSCASRSDSCAQISERIRATRTSPVLAERVYSSTEPTQPVDALCPAQSGSTLIIRSLYIRPRSSGSIDSFDVTGR